MLIIFLGRTNGGMHTCPDCPIVNGRHPPSRLRDLIGKRHKSLVFGENVCDHIYWKVTYI